MKHAVPIDNKNITEDWIYDMFYDYVEKPRNKSSLVGYIGNTLVGAELDFGDNVVTFRVIDGGDGYAEVLAKELTNINSDYVFTEIEIKGNKIRVSFWCED